MGQEVAGVGVAATTLAANRAYRGDLAQQFDDELRDDHGSAAFDAGLGGALSGRPNGVSDNGFVNASYVGPTHPKSGNFLSTPRS